MKIYTKHNKYTHCYIIIHSIMKCFNWASDINALNIYLEVKVPFIALEEKIFDINRKVPFR